MGFVNAGCQYAVALVEEGQDGRHELVDARVALVGVELVVAREHHVQVVAVDGATEPLDAVVEVAVDLDEADRSAGADAREGQAVQLVAGTQLVTGVADREVLEAARAVCVVDPTVGGIRRREAGKKG